MRLLWLSHFVPYPPTGHGALQRSYHLLRQAADRHEVHLVTLAPGAREGMTDELRAHAAALGEYAASVTVVPVRNAGVPLRNAARAAASVAGPSYWERLFARPGAVAACRRLLAASRFDLAHLDIVFLAPLRRELGATPVVLNHHNVESHLLRRRADQASLPGRLFFRGQARRTERVERELGRAAAQNLVVSALDGDRLRALVPGARTTVVPNGVDLDFFVPAPPGAPVRTDLVWAGGMDWFPNRDAIEWFAHELWPALAGAGAAASAAIVGRHPPAAVTQLAARDPRVRVLGFVDDVRPHVHGGRINVCPIRVGGGTRLKVLDALAMQRPLVSTAIGVEGLGLEPEVHYLEANDVAGFVRQVARLAADPALAARLAAAGRAHVAAHYSWSSIGRELERGYQAAADVARGAPAAAAR